MIYNAIVKDGGLFIPNFSANLDNQVQQSQAFQVSVTVINKLNQSKEIPASMRQAVGLLNQVDGVAYQNAQRKDWN